MIMPQYDVLKVIAIGSLIETQKRQSKNGKVYTFSTVQASTDEGQEVLHFSCFDERINKRLLSSSLAGERVKAIGTLRTNCFKNKNGVSKSYLNATVFHLEKARSPVDKIIFIAMGRLGDVFEQKQYIGFRIETNKFYKGKTYNNILEVKTNNMAMKTRLLNARGKRVLIRGRIIRVMNNGAAQQKGYLETICLLNRFSIIGYGRN
jgi:hypothetical protein